MPRGDKGKYTEKQKRQAEHIEEGYEERGVSEGEAERRAWATVNKSSGGGKKSGSGRGKAENKEPAKKGGKKGAASQSHDAQAQRRWRLEEGLKQEGSLTARGQSAQRSRPPGLFTLRRPRLFFSTRCLPQ
jgi:hypothetical protein